MHHLGTTDHPDDDAQRAAILSLTAGQLETLTYLMDSTAGRAEGVQLRELDRERRKNADALVIRGLALLVQGHEGWRRCVPTNAGRSILERFWRD